MAYNHKVELSKPERFVGGHRLCAGCGAGLVCRGMMRALDEGDKAVICNATSCLEVSSFLYPFTAWEDSYTAWKDSFIHNAFENAGATISGVETAYRAMKKRGKLDETWKFIAFGGDGGTYDIGFQSLSGAMERGHDMVYFCYDNEAYMNTGVQKSGLTPYGMKTTNTPSGKNFHGSQSSKKRMFEIVAAHGIPYAATASLGYPEDFMAKVEKAMNTDGTSYIHVMAPCPTGWGTPTDVTIDIGKEAVDCGLWYLAEYENGKFKINRDPKEFTSVEDYLKKQSRFANFDAHDFERVIAERDATWNRIRNDWNK